jgi:hypothetical protein
MRASAAHVWLSVSLTVFALAASACGGSSNDTSGEPKPVLPPDGTDPTPPKGSSDFVSADAVAGQTAGRDAAGDAEFGNGALAIAPAAMSPAGSSAQPREVAEGDIYRVLEGGKILNLNSYRGLQVIDVSDPTAPHIIGRHVVVGTPVEMYVRGTRALVLLNDWYGYYGARDDVRVEQREGGLLLSVDLSDPTAPRAEGSVFIEGYIRKSRLVSNDVTASLYVASSASGEVKNAQGYSEWIERTVVTSFDVSGLALVKKTELDLGGYVQDIQATPDALLVASSEYTGNTNRNLVSVVDISDPAGTMVKGDSVAIAGYVQNQFNLDLYKDVLRVVSTNWNGNGNTLETFDAADIHDVKPLHSCSFGGADQLYATLFLANKAFFVTYLRTDPFHAFSIADDGSCQEHAEYVVSGWNDFLRPVANGDRLIGIGTDDEGSGQAPAVSLYDITELTNPEPLLSRAQASQLQWSWSEAQYDHRAFSVLEGAVSIAAADGTLETGLVLLPYSGYTASKNPNGSVGQYVSGVQIFTFSDHSVTQRGAMDHDSEVRRSFLADADTTVNLSETSLALYDHSDPSTPVRLGAVELAPDYGRVLRFGDYLARVKRPSHDYQSYEYTADDEVETSKLQIIAANADANTAEPLAELELPVDARLVKSGDLLVSMVYRVVGPQMEWPYDYETTVHVYDLSDPTHPVERGSAQTDALIPSYDGYGGYGGYYGGRGGFGFCGVGDFWFSGNQVDGTLAIGDALVFTQARDHDELLGHEHTCSYYPRYRSECDQGGCDDYLNGYRNCSSLDGAPEVCTDELYLCDQTVTADSCEQVEFDAVRTQLDVNCYDGERRRYWSSYEITALDLSDPDAPVFGATTAMPAEEEGVRVLPVGSSLYYTYKIPAEIEGDARPHVRYSFKELDFSDPSAPSVSAAVNIPGELIAVDGDRLYTKDLRWGDERAETFLHELTRDDGVAQLEASQRFAQREVSKVVVAGGQLLVSHGPVYNNYFGPTEDEQLTKLTMLARRGLAVQGEVEVDSWSTLEAVHDGRALYTVPGGLLVINVEQPTAPFAQGFFHTNGWPEQILFEAGEITIAAGRYGIHRFDADAFNLLTD